jgi:dipeptidyl aminopeptidase/acylaminoacyl peptidase
MSPFMNANKMKTPLYWCMGKPIIILEHSLYRRYFQALKGLGAPVRMVILPKEAHSYAAKRIYYIFFGNKINS